jgi:hypothetical protein
MSKKSIVNRYLLATARIVYVFGTVALVVAALAILNIGGH